MEETQYGIRKHFKHTFSVIEEQRKFWKLQMENAKSHLTAILTLNEILCNCSAAKLMGTNLLSSYPDIKDRVTFKVENELHDEKAKLDSIL